jgi:hypothetical protein
MRAGTTQRVKVELGDATAQALWAAMHEDDDLANQYADLCVVHGLRHLVQDMSSNAWTTAELVKLHSNLGEAAAQCLLREEEVAQRFASYSEPPF